MPQAPRKYFKFFKNVRNEPRRFEYKPRHYSEEDEEWKARTKRIEREVAMERGEKVDYEPGTVNFRETWSRQKRQTSRSKSALIRLLVILVALIIASYYALQWLEKYE